MVENRREEFLETERRALRMLKDVTLSPPDGKGREPAFRISVFPSKSPYIVWTFFESKGEKSDCKDWFVAEVRWDRNAEQKRFVNPLEGLKQGFHANPKLETKWFRDEKNFVERYFSELKRINLPPFAHDESFGLDGVSYCIETLSSYSNTRIYWWNSCFSPEWKDLVNWFERFEDLLQNEFSKLP